MTLVYKACAESSIISICGSTGLFLIVIFLLTSTLLFRDRAEDDPFFEEGDIDFCSFSSSSVC